MVLENWNLKCCIGSFCWRKSQNGRGVGFGKGEEREQKEGKMVLWSKIIFHSDNRRGSIKFFSGDNK